MNFWLVIWVTNMWHRNCAVSFIKKGFLIDQKTIQATAFNVV